MDSKVIVNIGADRPVTYFGFIVDVARTLGIGVEHIKPDGVESGWPANSTLSVGKLADLGYPGITYDRVLETITSDLHG
jgi:hypothetical protein